MAASTFQKGEVNKLTSLEQFKSAIAEPGFVVIDCFATWCGPCKVIAPAVEELAKKHEGLRFYQVDVDGAPDVAQELGIRAMPTFKFFLNGEAQDDVVGANTAALTEAVEKGAQAASA